MKIVRKSMLALLLAASVPMTGQAAGIVSTVVTASDDIVVSSNAEATVTATGRTDLIAGNYPANFVVATWSASVTAGTVAYRLTRAVNGAFGTFGPIWGLSVNSSDSSKSIAIGLNVPGDEAGTQVTENGWRVLQQGKSKISNGAVLLAYTNSSYALTPGSYPIGIEVAAYAY
ncbi:hypothetical protein RGI97_001084 [Serratia marcescens]